jgi:DNA primase
MSRTAVEQIKERLTILDVVGQYVELHKAGKSYKGKSPFTNEKTPSFYVSPDRGMYYCFSSNQGGDMFTFIEKMEGVDFKGALKILAEKAHVELVPEDSKKRDERETMYALLEEATSYFEDMLMKHPHAHEYVTSRGVNEYSIRAWRIGYAPDDWRAVKKYLEGKGYKESDIFRAGLIKDAGEGKERYDVFRDRIMFPICDPSGRVVAFSGRTMKKEDGVPKYVNSPETEFYKKSEILYGYDKAKNGIRQYDFSLLVEGQFDLVLTHQAGYGNTVAVSGTAFTPHHLMLLTRLSNRAVLALDSDRAGIAAVKRVAGMMLARGMDVKVAEMPFGKDPADVVRQDPQELKHAIGKATHVIEFLLKVLKESAKDERTFKLVVREELLPVLATIENRIDREHFEQVVADAMGTTKDAVHYEISRIEERSSAEREKTQGNPMLKQENQSVNNSVAGESRKQSLVHHLFAYTLTLDDDRALLRDEVTQHLRRLIGDEEYDVLTTKKAESDIAKVLFEVETRIDELHPKELVSDLETMLTTLSHLIARERLAHHKRMVEDAERIKDDERVKAELHATKEAQNLLGTTIELSM